MPGLTAGDVHGSTNASKSLKPLIVIAWWCLSECSRISTPYTARDPPRHPRGGGVTAYVTVQAF
jgi:hypothetical protein